ncbi:MAG TPA: tetratricopeptide repeat protein [Thermoanaerobaculia bacterium]|nr:tetratricopeptide repeat protein [Thermoanaerobaculia bacterium]
MTDRHYNDEALIALLESNLAASDTHLPSCTACSAKLQSVRSVAHTLRDAAVWDTRPLADAPVASTIANLRAFANQIADEDTRAEAYLRDLLAGPRETWMANLAAHPEYRTAGTVRKLVAAASRAVDTMPPDAVEMTALAVEVAEHLDGTAYASDTVARVRGTSWRERSFSLYYVGRFAEALVAADRAEKSFANCVVDEYERARVDVIRALILRATEDFGAAAAAAKRGAETFGWYEDINRMATAKLAEVHLLFTSGRYSEAAAILEGIEVAVRLSNDVDTHARIYANLGHCYWKLARLDEAIQYLGIAAALFEDLGVPTESARMRWNIASIFVTTRRLDEALERFQILKADFDRLEMNSEAAVIGLDIAELLLARGEFSRVEEICREAIARFTKAGIAYGARALTALAYIHEAVREKTATPIMARHVREFLRRLPTDDTVLFAPPPI